MNKLTIFHIMNQSNYLCNCKSNISIKLKHYTVQYKIIKSESQYEVYCNKLHEVVINPMTRNSDEVELLTLLVEKWDSENIIIPVANPIETINALMKEHKLNATDLGKILNLSKGTISKMLNYNKGLTKETIRILATHFKLSQEIFNQPYKLENDINRTFKNAAVMNTKKHIKNVNQLA
jgi:HTH-type transcriptional regulator / antitoxin HigA